jgi:hypothetical protein
MRFDPTLSKTTRVGHPKTLRPEEFLLPEGLLDPTLSETDKGGTPELN